MNYVEYAFADQRILFKMPTKSRGTWSFNMVTPWTSRGNFSGARADTRGHYITQCNTTGLVTQNRTTQSKIYYNYLLLMNGVCKINLQW